MIDSHCHLDQEPLLSDLNSVIERSKLVGIQKILTICTTVDSFKTIKEILNRDEIIYGTFGIHPHEVKNNKISLDYILKEIVENKKIIGVGETGLDFHYNNSEKSEQIDSFNKHIQASLQLDIPLIVHSRNAEKETFEILKNYENDKLKILMHCFTGSKEFAKKLLDLNAYFSASGIITFKNSTNLQDTFESIPLDRLLIETDSPFLSPVPKRGKKNEPSFIKFTAEKLAQIKKISSKELIDLTTKNFNKLFN
tara:strand:- start:404 stop:1162 length:759 start_codon:yes stop_codon:yes gene_type:complete